MTQADRLYGYGCLHQVELLEMPFTVITMGEVNIVNLERVGFNLRNFDMTIVFKARPWRLHGTDMSAVFTACKKGFDMHYARKGF